MKIASMDLDHNKLDAAIEIAMLSPSFNQFSRIMMADDTLCLLFGVHFRDKQATTYMGVPIIQCEDVPYGECVVLTQYV